ncbi:MAG TPA: S8 family serine peptidase, partial [Steroidobacteraceae bacterium]|nr:S8 family serine peptidase [Steroidobacteraceae bacterium]
DVTSSPNDDCKNATAQSSSWHGTRTAGILGALTNNATGIAGMTWQGQILPVRVLGKCGGFDSDIVSAMLWAAGIAVTGAPANPTPARIINMSLGGTGSCPAMYQDAIQQIQAKGVLVVVSAGNEGGPVDAPANCAGVAGVAGLRQVGTKVGFSSLGPEIALSAPAGNCVNTTISATTPCEYSIETTTNDGAQGPGNNIYTDQVNDTNLGTSFSAPIVSGIAALMSSVNSHLNACQLIARLKEGASAFPQTSADAATQPPACHVPASSTDLQTAECICTTDGKTCGAGMASAAGAVAAALRPIAVVSVPTSVSAGKSAALNASGSAAANGHAISSYQWTNAGTQTVTIQNGTSSTADVTAPTCGYATIQVVVTDDAGREDAAEIVLSPTSATSIAPSSAAATTCNTTTPPVLLAVCPTTSSVLTGGTQAFTATVANTTDVSVTWQVNGVAGGNATLGTVSTSGVYTAPASVPSPATVTVQAVSQADQTVMSSTSVTITAPPSSHGGGAIDWPTLFAQAIALSVALVLRRYRRRLAASSQSL